MVSSVSGEWCKVDLDTQKMDIETQNQNKNQHRTKKEIAIMGDDLQDLAAMKEVGIFFTTPNAIKIVKDKAHYITKRTGGDGAVREICDLIISSKGSSSNSEFKRFIKRRG